MQRAAQSTWQIRVLSFQINKIVIVDEVERGADHGCGIEVDKPQILREIGDFLDLPISVRERQIRVFARKHHESHGNVHFPPAVVLLQ